MAFGVGGLMVRGQTSLAGSAIDDTVVTHFPARICVLLHSWAGMDRSWRCGDRHAEQQSKPDRVTSWRDERARFTLRESPADGSGAWIRRTSGLGFHCRLVIRGSCGLSGVTSPIRPRAEDSPNGPIASLK